MKSVQSILLETSTFLLAGGRGSRLTPLTRRRSKPAVPFGDRCIIDFPLSISLTPTLSAPHLITKSNAPPLTRHVGGGGLGKAPFGVGFPTPPVGVPAATPAYSGTADALFRNNHLLNQRD